MNGIMKKNGIVDLRRTFFNATAKFFLVAPVAMQLSIPSWFHWKVDVLYLQETEINIVIQGFHTDCLLTSKNTIPE